MLSTILGWIFKIAGVVQSVRVRCHVASFEGSSELYVFINVVNLSLSRDVEITHIWFECPDEISVLNSQRPLPKRLRPEESWETWIGLDSFEGKFSEYVFSLARVRVSNGKVYRSKRNTKVPKKGNVPGGK